MNQTLIAVEHVTKTFPLPEGKGDFTALSDVSLSVRSTEVLALLGRSGSGKSTLLRIMAGLIPPTTGSVTNGGKPLAGPNADVAMVFQGFALLPWLTVIENVELGLVAAGLERHERAKRALKAIDMVGLDGFESAYPKELSGGMKQRVGLARALAVEPKVLFMDEPFSALDVLTAENLRGEIDDLWNSGAFPSSSILLVTHNIEEAVLLADRVVVLGSNPGHIRGEIQTALERPHNRNDGRFKRLVEHLYTVMTNPELEVAADSAGGGAPKKRSPYSRALPHVRVGGISGFLELLLDMGNGPQDIARVADRLALTEGDLFSLIDAVRLLGFADVAGGAVTLTPLGRDFASATILQSKEIFAKQALDRMPMIAAIVRALHEKANKSMRAEFFLDILDEYFPLEEAKRQFATAVDWGRYAELFEFDAVEDRVYLPDAPAIKSA